MPAFVIKKTEKSILVGLKNSKYSQGYDAIGYCGNPDALEVGAEVVGFVPKGVCQKSIGGKVLTTKTGEPLSFWVF